MLLKPLTDALALVRDRIKNFAREFTNNETQTRLSLVDPVLKALDWNPEDPTTVRVEYPVRQRNRNNIRVDYALLDSKHEPVAFVEAKKLGNDLGDAHLQLFEYAVGKSVPYAIATNGAAWTVFKKENEATRVSIDVLLEVSLLDQSPTLTAIKLLSLWKGLLTSQNSIDQIAPALSLLESKPLKHANQAVQLPNTEPLTDEAEASITGTKSHNLNVSGDKSATNKGNSFNLNDPPDVSHRKPVELLLPDGTRRQIYKWSSLLREVAQWLLATNILTVDIPWKTKPNSNRNTLQQSAICNKYGVKIKQQVQLDRNLFLLTNYDSRAICNTAAKLLTDCGVQSSKVTVILAARGG